MCFLKNLKFDIQLGMDFLKTASKAQAVKEKINTFDKTLPILIFKKRDITNYQHQNKREDTTTDPKDTRQTIRNNKEK